MATTPTTQAADDVTDGSDLLADDNTEIEVGIVDDTPPADQGRRPLDAPVADPTDEEMQGYSDAVKNRIKKLTHARHDERRQREALEREHRELTAAAQRLLDENRGLKQYVNAGEQQFSGVIKQAVAAELETAKRDLREALNAGDPDKIVDAQTKLADVTTRLQRANDFRPTPLPVEQPVVQQQLPAAPKPALDDKTLRWKAKNQWFGADGHEDMTSLALGLHQKMMRDGVDPRSDEYFSRIDARLRTAFPDFFVQGATKPGGAASPRQATVVAPASRSAAKRTVTLTASAARLAERLGLTPEQYAREVMKLEAQ